MSSMILAGDTSGSIEVKAPLVAGSNVQTLVPATGDLAPIIRGTAVTASGTAIDFTGIPSWVKRITVMFNGVSTSGTSPLHVRLGTTSGIESTGYANAISEFLAGVSTTFNITNAIAVENATGNLSAAATRRGLLTLVNFNGNEWVYTSTVGSSVNGLNFLTTGGKTLAGLLTQLRITTLNGTDTFDAGTINIMYE